MRRRPGETNGHVLGKAALTVGLCVVVAVCVGLGLALFGKPTGATVEPVDGPTASIETADAHANESLLSRRETSDRAALVTGARPPARPREEEAPPVRAAEYDPRPGWLVAGRIVDPLGTPIPGIRVALAGEHVAAVTDRQGRFGMFTDRWGGDLTIPDPEWFLLADAFASVRTPTGHLLIAAKRSEVTGQVIDESGAPIAGTRVLGRVPLSSIYAGDLSQSRPKRYLAAEVDEEGRFRLSIPLVDGVTLRASAKGYEDQTRSAAPMQDVLFVLERSAMVHGIVVHQSGRPASGARVALGNTAGTTDASGRFEIRLGRVWDRAPLVAGLKGFGPAVVPDFGKVVAAAAGGATGPIVLELGGGALSISGHVVETNGRPCRGWLVGVNEPRRVFFDGTYYLPEELAAGDVLKDVTNEDGAFRLDGLTQRAYDVVAVNRETLGTIESRAVLAGSEDVRIVIDPTRFNAVRGRVVFSDGSGVDGARVSLQTIGSEALKMGSSRATKTDAEGYFSFSDVLVGSTYLRVRHEESLPIRRSRLEDASPLVHVQRRCGFRVECEHRPRLPTGVRAENALGEGLDLWEFRANGGRGPVQQIELFNGTSSVFSTQEDVSALVLFDDDSDLARITVAPVPGGVRTVRW